VVSSKEGVTGRARLRKGTTHATTQPTGNGKQAKQLLLDSHSMGKKKWRFYSKTWGNRIRGNSKRAKSPRRTEKESEKEMQSDSRLRPHEKLNTKGSEKNKGKIPKKLELTCLSMAKKKEKEGVFTKNGTGRSGW